MTKDSFRQFLEPELELLLAHGEGELGRVLISGLRPLPGTNPSERLAWLNGAGDGQGDALRRFLVYEPRGFAQMSTNLALPPFDARADVALFVLQPDAAHAMSGSNSICLATSLLESGHLPQTEGETQITIETAIGLVRVRSRALSAGCRSVHLETRGVYAVELDYHLEVPELGRVSLDLAFGGVFFALVDAERLGLRLHADSTRELSHAATCIQHALSAAGVVPVHRHNASLSGIAYTMFTGQTASGELLGANVMPPGRVDRSPCGTGTSARLACMAARGNLAVGAQFRAHSLFGTRIDIECRALEASATGYPTIDLALTGRGWWFGRETLFTRLADDPFPEGHTPGDTWGEAQAIMRHGHE